MADHHRIVEVRLGEEGREHSRMVGDRDIPTRIGRRAVARQLDQVHPAGPGEFGGERLEVA